MLTLSLGVITEGWADQRALNTENTEQIDAVLLLDSSGSMLQTDPKRLRDEGAKLFLEFLRPGDRVAVVSFDRSSTVVRRFSDFNRQDLAAIHEQITKIGATGEYTDLLAGISGAVDILKKEKRPEAVPVIVLLSDGKMEPDPAVAAPYGRSEELLNQFLPGLREQHMRVHTLSFSDLADKKLLADISAATEGGSWFTPTSEKIHESFAQLFLAIKKPQVVPLTGKGFSIDGDVQEATFYINREEGAITVVSPSGQEIRAEDKNPQVRWFHGQKFDVITVLQPDTGNWQIRGLTSSDSFATVLTNVKLVSDWPTTVPSGDGVLLQARMNDGDKPVVLKEMSSATTYEFQVIPADKVSEPILEGTLEDGGTGGDKIAGDGIFSRKLQIEEPGEYKLWLIAHAPTFERRQQLPFRVRPPLIRVEVVSAEKVAKGEEKANQAAHGHGHGDGHEKGEKSDHGETDHAESKSPDGEVILVTLSPEVESLQQVEVKLAAIDEKKRRFALPIRRMGDNLHFGVSVNLLPKPGDYDLIASLSAESKKRGSVREATKPLRYHKEEGPTTGQVVVVEEEKVVDTSGPPVWPFALLILLGNGAFGAATIRKLQAMQKAGNVEMPTFVSGELAEAAISELKERNEKKEISFTDPLLKNEVILPDFSDDGGAPPPPPSSPPSQPPAEAAPAAEAESAPPAPEEEAAATEGGEPASEEGQG